MKENGIKAVIAAMLAWAAAYSQKLIIPIMVLVVAMIADYVSGMTRAWMESKLSSRVGLMGIVKKVAYLLAVGVAITTDWVVQTAASEIGVEFGGFFYFGLLVTIWLILNECISILENISEIGVPLPPFLVKLVDKLQKSANDKGEEIMK